MGNANWFGLDELLKRVASGDRKAFEELYRRSSPHLFGVCLRILKDASEAEEVLQEVFVTLWAQASTFDRTKGSAIAWMNATTRNRSIDRLRSRKPVSAPLEFAEWVADPNPNGEDVAIAESDSKLLHECMSKLEADDIALIRTAYFEGATYEDLSLRTSRPLGTIKSRIRRAFINLRKCMA